MNKRYFVISVLAALVVGGLIVGGIFSFREYANKKYDAGLADGRIEGRREVINTILINVANEGNIVIRQGDNVLTLVPAGE